MIEQLVPDDPPMIHAVGATFLPSLIKIQLIEVYILSQDFGLYHIVEQSEDFAQNVSS